MEENLALDRSLTTSSMGTSRQAKYEGVYPGRWVEVIVESVKFSSDCFRVLNKVGSKIIR